MQRMAACLASWFSVDGPLSPDCSAPLNVNQLTKLNTADSPLTWNRDRKLTLLLALVVRSLQSTSQMVDEFVCTDLKVFPPFEEKFSH